MNHTFSISCRSFVEYPLSGERNSQLWVDGNVGNGMNFEDAGKITNGKCTLLPRKPSPGYSLNSPVIFLPSSILTDRNEE